MLSIKTIKSAGHALQYYRDIINYYAKDVANVEDKSQWYGKGAEILGLSGMIGDPTDKTSARQQLTRAQVLDNCKSFFSSVYF